MEATQQPVVGGGEAEGAAAGVGLAEAAGPRHVPGKDGLRGIVARLFPDAELGNPGRFDNHNREAEHAVVNMDLFDGVAFNVTRGVSDKLASIHSVRIGGTTVPPGYEFGTHYATEKVQLVGRMSMDGIVSANYIHMVTPNLTTTAKGQFLPENQFQGAVEADYDGQDFSAKASLTNGGAVSLSVMQALTPQAAVGLQVINAAARQIFGGQLVGRYNTPDFTAVASVSSFGIAAASYVQKLSPKVSLATTLEYSIPTGHSEVMTGYDYNLRTARIQGRVTSSGTIACYMEAKNIVWNPGMSFILNGTADYVNQRYSFGYGFQMQA